MRQKGIKLQTNLPKPHHLWIAKITQTFIYIAHHRFSQRFSGVRMAVQNVLIKSTFHRLSQPRLQKSHYLDFLAVVLASHISSINYKLPQPKPHSLLAKNYRCLDGKNHQDLHIHSASSFFSTLFRCQNGSIECLH